MYEERRQYVTDQLTKIKRGVQSIMSISLNNNHRKLNSHQMESNRPLHPKLRHYACERDYFCSLISSLVGCFHLQMTQTHFLLLRRFKFRIVDNIISLLTICRLRLLPGSALGRLIRCFRRLFLFCFARSLVSFIPVAASLENQAALGP